GRLGDRQRAHRRVVRRAAVRPRRRARPPAPGRALALARLHPLRLPGRRADRRGVDAHRRLHAPARALRRDALPADEGTPMRRLASQALIVLALVLATAGPGRAQVARTFTPRFNVQTTGDVTLIGNTSMTC